MKHRSLLITLAWTASLAAAWWAGQAMQSHGTDAAASGKNAVQALTDGSKLGSQAISPKPGVLTPAGFPSEKVVSYYRDANVPVKERMEKVMGLEDPVERMAGYLELLKSLSTDEEMAAAVAEMGNNFDGRTRGRELSMLMSLWAQRNPEAALAEAGKLKDWGGRYGVDTALSTWTKNDPDAAKNWALANYKPKDKDDTDGNWAMLSVINTLAKKDLDKAILWAQEQPRSRARGEMMDRLVSNMESQRGLDWSQQWAMTLPEGPFREGVLRKVAWETTEKDPAKSAAWIAAMPKSDAKLSAFNDLVDHWASRDPNAAGQWLQQFGSTPEMDGPRRTFAWEIRDKDPESAVAWAGTIQDQKQRNKMMVELMRDWSKRDQVAATTYMQRNNWPEEAQKKVIR